MSHQKAKLVELLRSIDFGSSVAETDQVLESARVETSVFTDLLNDKVDLIPGTKGSGKSALYRIFVDFLPDLLLEQRKVVIAHGVQRHGDKLFNAYYDAFSKMDENDFVSFWCVYLVSLANEHFIKSPRYSMLIKDCQEEVQSFRRACKTARIPDFQEQMSILQVLGWVLAVLRSWKPKIKYRPPGDVGEFEVSLFGELSEPSQDSQGKEEKVILPNYVQTIKDTLEAVLKKAGLNLWLMIDRLDEIFPRRSSLETCALRGLLRTLQIFESREIRVKVFLRDDILEQVVSEGAGFTALTHVTARASDTLQWSESQILTMIVKRLYASFALRAYMGVDQEHLEANRKYQEEAFYKVFPPAVNRGKNQSSTLRWIYNHTADGRNVVTPRDVIILLTKAKQRQYDEFQAATSGESDFVIGPAAIKYGLVELSKHKRSTFLEAEFPHFLLDIKKLVGGKTEYSETAMRSLFGQGYASVIDNLISIGVIGKERKRDGSTTFKIPFLYRTGLELTQGRA